MPADQKHHITAAHLRFSEQLGKCGGIHSLACRIEQYLAGTRVAAPEIYSIGTDFAHLRGSITLYTAKKVFGQSISIGVFWLSDEVKKDFHSAGTGTVLAFRHRRS